MMRGGEVVDWSKAVRGLAIGSTAIVGLSWLTHSVLELSHGVGTGTLYADALEGRTGVHWAVIACEMSLGAWLLVGRRPRTALLVSIFLLSMFSAFILRAPSPKPCGCLGQRPAKSRHAAIENMRWSVARNGSLIALSVIAMVCATNNRSPPAEPGQGANADVQ
jgi:hypothetical protein